MICRKMVLVAFVALMVSCVTPAPKQGKEPVKLHPIEIKQEQKEQPLVHIARRVLEKRKKIRMTVSAYIAPKSKVTGKRRLTATMKKPVVGVTVAVSRDKKHMLGKRVWVGRGIGYRKVTDLMHWRWKNKMDVLVATRGEAIEFGLKREVRVIVL